MRKLVFIFFFAAVLIRCKDSAEQSPLALGLTKTIGGKISLDDAERWAARYKSMNTNARTETTAGVSATTFRVFIDNLGEYEGLHFKHALDDEGKHHILIVAQTANADQSVAIDTYADEYIDQAVAEAWAANYVNANPSSIRSHFFGSLVFTSILSHREFVKLVVTPGIDDAGKPQLLLYAWNDTGESSGRKKSQAVDVYDLSTTCPPHC